MVRIITILCHHNFILLCKTTRKSITIYGDKQDSWIKLRVEKDILLTIVNISVIFGKKRPSVLSTFRIKASH